MKINNEDYIEVIVPDVHGATNASEAFSMILVQKEQPNYYLPILIGINEARAIIGEIHNNLPFRPLTHTLLPDLFLNIIKDYSIEFVSIDNYENGIFFASIVIKNPNNTFSKLDARPSDAIAIALHSIVPIYFNSKLWNEQHLSKDDKFSVEKVIETDPYNDTNFLQSLSIPELKKLLESDIEQELYEHAALIQKIINEKEKGL